MIDKVLTINNIFKVNIIIIKGNNKQRQYER